MSTHSGSSILNRRKFLKLSAGATVTLVVGGSVLRWFTGGYASQLGPNEVPIAMSPKEFAIMKSLIQALLPAEEGFPSGESLQLPQRMDEELWAASPRMRGDLKNALQLLEHAPLTLGIRSRFSALTAEQRLSCFNKYHQGSNAILAQIAGGLKEMIHFFYYSQPPVWPLIGYDGPFVPVAVPPASHLAYAEILRAKKVT